MLEKLARSMKYRFTLDNNASAYGHKPLSRMQTYRCKSNWKVGEQSDSNPKVVAAAAGSC